MTTPVPSFSIGFSSFLQAIRAPGPINSWMGSKFGRIQQGTAELAALVSLENLHRLILEKCCNHSIYS